MRLKREAPVLPFPEQGLFNRVCRGIIPLPVRQGGGSLPLSNYAFSPLAFTFSTKSMR